MPSFYIFTVVLVVNALKNIIHLNANQFDIDRLKALYIFLLGPPRNALGQTLGQTN